MPRPTVRLKMTLLYAGVFFVASALLLSVSYVLVRNNLTNPGNISDLPHDNWSYNVAAQHEIATDALRRLRTQYAMALLAMTGLSVLLGWGVAGRVLRVAPALRQLRAGTVRPWQRREQGARRW